MPTIVVYRQPWFWGVMIALVAVFAGAIMINASSPRQNREDTTIVQQPAPASNPAVVATVPTTVPTTSTFPATPAPVSPAPTARTVAPARPAPPVIVREKTVIIHDRGGDNPDNAPAAQGPTSTTVPAADQFQATGLPKRLRYDDARWRATSTTVVVDPDVNLTSIGTTEDGTQLFVKPGAAEPYQTVLAPVAEEPGTYVEYHRR